MNNKDQKEENNTGHYSDNKKGLVGSLKSVFSQEKVEPQIPVHMKVSQILASQKK